MSHRILNQRVAALEQANRKTKRTYTPEEADALVASWDAEASRTGVLGFAIDEDAPWTPEQATDAIRTSLRSEYPDFVIIGVYGNGDRREFQIK